MTIASDRQAEVLRLGLVEGLPMRAIAKKLGMSRRSVARVLGRGSSRKRKPAAPRTTILEPFEAAIRQLLDDCPEIRAPAVLERIRPLGYTGGITTVRDRLQQIRPTREQRAYFTLHFEPGQATQVDWADFGFAIPGVPRRVSAFVMALCYSRYLYVEFTLSQSLGSLLRCMERGIAFFGGTTTMDMFDNMKTVVLAHPPTGPVFNQQFLAYAASRHFAVHACHVRRANEKGRVERPIGFIRSRFWPGRRFTDVLDLNRQAASWRDDFANNRIHDATGKVPRLVFRELEQSHLRPVPETPFNTDDVQGTTVTKTFRVRFDRNLYSVPHWLVSQNVVIRANEAHVRVFLGPKLVSQHDRCWAVGNDLELPEHREQLQEHRRPQAGQLPQALSCLGDRGREYLRTYAATHRSIERELIRLTFLVEVFGRRAAAEALDEVMRTGHVGSEYIEYVLRHQKNLRPTHDPLRLGREDLDRLHLDEPDLGIYDRAPRLLDPHGDGGPDAG